MTDWAGFVQLQLSRGARAAGDAQRRLVAAYGDPAEEYAAIAAGPAIIDRSYRGLLQVVGRDRAAWLHNITTNHIKDLAVGTGRYALALNRHGRIVFDLNVLVRPDSIWIDLHRCFVAAALAHLDKFIITEDVRVVDHSDEFVRLGIAGVRGIELLGRLGIRDAGQASSLDVTEVQWSDVVVPVARHDFCGTFGAELFVPAYRAVDLWRELTEGSLQPVAVPAGDEAVQMHRVEAGVPWSGREITDEYLPAESGLLERTVSLDKGCYPGQEVVERMRSRGAVARHLVGLLLHGHRIPPGGAEILGDDGKRVGSVTSACRSPVRDAVVGLGYCRVSSCVEGTAVRVSWGGDSVRAVVAPLPLTEPGGR
ncbi:MAG: YgfZ/GcvT domain-containing protein [Phycisphaerae bacterium]